MRRERGVGTIAARGDRAAHELGADRARRGVVVVELELGGPVRVHVTREHDGVADLRVDPAAGDAVARGLVAVPRVHREGLDRTLGAVALGEEDLLADDVPAGARPAEAVEEPPLLGGPDDRAVRVDRGGAVGLVAVATALVVAELTGVEHVERREPPPVQPAEQLKVGAAGERRATQRHVLVVGAERGGAPCCEALGLERVLGRATGPVVVDLVVVPHDEPGRDGVRLLQVEVGLVLRVPLPVRREVDGLGTLVVAHVARGRDVVVRGVLVLVVTEVEDELRLLLGESAVRREEAVLVLGARGERHAQRRRQRACGRRGAGAAGAGHERADLEAVPVLASRPQVLDLDVHGEALGCRRAHGAALDNGTEALVGGHLPAHGVDGVGHAAEAVVRERVERETGPEDEAVGNGVAGRDAEREGAAPKVHGVGAAVGHGRPRGARDRPTDRRESPGRARAERGAGADDLSSRGHGHHSTCSR